MICVSVLHIFPTLDQNNLPFATLQLLVSNAVASKNGRATVLSCGDTLSVHGYYTNILDTGLECVQTHG